MKKLTKEKIIARVRFDAMPTIQDIYLELIKRSSFNDFVGPRVANDLEANRDLWQGVLMTRTDTGITLRDLEHNYNNVNTLWILSSGKNDKELEKLARTWSWDEQKWYTKDESKSALGTGSTKYRILELWWD